MLSDKCQQWAKWQKKTNDPRYNEWKTSHKSKIDHDGSGNIMETSGAVRIFERSLASRALKHKDILGDGDSSPYGGNKLEFIGHLQKGVENRLQKLKNIMKGVKVDDGNGLSGKGRLTYGKIGVLQNYYGLAVRGNLHEIGKMAKSIKASLYHVASTEDNPQHHLCPDGKDNWCGYWREKES